VNGYALDVFSPPQLPAHDAARTCSPCRAVRALGQRALDKPTVLVTNESSLSDAEDFTEGYRSLGLGKVVGQPTAGWIIFTGSERLIDGSTVRLPGSRIQGSAGDDMEMHPRAVDQAVERPLGGDPGGNRRPARRGHRTVAETGRVIPAGPRVRAGGSASDF
jgi:tricorn protease